jgi:hydrogenase maturation protease
LNLMQTLIVGLGNPILGDDGAGWRIAEQVAARLPQPACPLDSGTQPLEQSSVQVECLGLGGLSLMEHLIGFDRAILVDAILTGDRPIGTVTSFPLDELPDIAAGHLSSTHDTTLQNALRVGRAMGASLPDEILVVAVEAQSVYDFSEDLTPQIAQSIPIAVQMVMELIK